MRILWICGLPREVEKRILGGEDFGSFAAWSWILSHLPPPESIDLHIACEVRSREQQREIVYKGATFHLVPVLMRARLFTLYWFDARYYRPLMERLRPDVVHGWGTEQSYSRVAVDLSPKHHLVGIQGLIREYRRTVRMHWLTFFSALCERQVLAKARHVVVESGYCKRITEPLCRNVEIQVIEHPLREEFLEATPTSGDAAQVLFIGAITPRKGVLDAIHAFSRAAPEGWRFAIAGSGPPEYVAEMNRCIGALGEENRVAYLGTLTVEEIVTVMQQSSVFLLPTQIDTGPTVLKEALRMGLWPVCYDNSGPGEYIRKFSFGSLARDGDVTDLEAVLEEALRTQPWRDPDRRGRLATTTKQVFSRAHVWNNLTAVYGAIIQTSSAAGGGSRG